MSANFLIQSQVHQGAIHLEGSMVKDAQDYTKKPFSFSITHPLRKSFYLVATSQTEMDEWVLVLNEKIANLRAKTPN
jgi:hypothetical protein